MKNKEYQENHVNQISHVKMKNPVDLSTKSAAYTR